MSMQSTQPQSIGGVLDTTFQLYKASVVKMIPLSLLTVVAGSPASIYAFTQGGVGDPANPFAMIEMMSSMGYILSALVGMIASLWMMSAAYLKIGAIGMGGDLGIGPALQQSVTRLPVVVIMMLLFGIAVGIGCLLLLVPGLILMVSLALCFNTALFENKGPVDSLTESHRLVWGNWWRTAAIFTVGFIVIFVIYMLAALVIGLITPFIVFGAGASENALLIGMVGGLLVGVLMSLLVTPFYISLAIATYWDLKLRKDGGDLAARIGALNPA